MQLSHERIQELKDLLEKKSGKEVPWDEAAEAGRKLVGLVKLVLEGYEEDVRRKHKLKESPKGFVLDGVGYSCFICGSGTRAGENWYDRWGIKCRTCQDGINRKEIPSSLAKHKDSWYSKYDLERCFNLRGPTLTKWIKQGIIKARYITYDGKRPHVYLFLLKDNKGFLPPKKLVESYTVKKEKDGKTWFQSVPWYRCVDPKERLKGYKILDYLAV